MTSHHGESYEIPQSQQIFIDEYEFARLQMASAETLYDLAAIPRGTAIGVLAIESPYQNPECAEEFLFWRRAMSQTELAEWSIVKRDGGLLPVTMIGACLLEGGIRAPLQIKRNISFWFKQPLLTTLELDRRPRTYRSWEHVQTGPVIDYAIRTTL